ncbi:unnamed protein product, partial [Didymodactylos carnosus]
FLDSQHIDHLTRYLEALHHEKLANVDHTTLLLNCYTKHPDRIQRLDQFIGLASSQQKSSTDQQNRDNDSGVSEELSFDVDTGIDVCRQAGYFKQALALSEKYRRHHKYIKIQIENMKDYDQALKYIQTLKFQDALDVFKTYGKTLVDQRPDLTTKLLKQLNPTPQEIEEQKLPDSLIDIFMNHPNELLEYLEFATTQYANVSSSIYDIILELYLQNFDKIDDKKAKDKRSKQILALLQNTKLDVDPHRAMIACQKYNFKPGVICLYEKAKLYQQILQYQMDNKDSDEILATCTTYGVEDSQLWIQALSYFSKLKRSVLE